MNNSVGGLNSESILAASYLSDYSLFVWFPTINAENFLKKSTYEIAPEWVNKKGFIARKSDQVEPVILYKNKVIKILKMIKKCNAVLATGHISWQESMKLVKKALQIGVRKIVITHPIYQRI